MMNINSLFGLEGKTAMVTGGYGHLGAAMVEVLAAAGAIVLVAGRDVARAQALCDRLRSENPDFAVTPSEMDVTDSRSVSEALDAAVVAHGAVDIMVNNAAKAFPGRLEETSDSAWSEGVRSALDSAFVCIREAARCMGGTGGGSIINVGSMYGLVSPDFRVYEGAEKNLSPPSYGAAKAGLMQLTRYCAVYFADSAIRVNAVSPGPFPQSTRPEDKEFIRRLAARVPLGRIGKPADLRGAVLFLASDASAFVTGHNLVVDGGWTVV
jgi:NAD(P)-dependent dehydrogenase (short-subunit alcohol dehydrogenase family)